MNRKLPLDSHRQRELDRAWNATAKMMDRWSAEPLKLPERGQPLARVRANDLIEAQLPKVNDCPNRTKFINQILAKKRGA